LLREEEMLRRAEEQLRAARTAPAEVAAS